jgi:hypothetical protein
MSLLGTTETALVGNLGSFIISLKVIGDWEKGNCGIMVTFNSIYSTCTTSENVVSSSSEKSIGSNKAPNLVGSRIQFVRLGPLVQ